MSAQRKLLGGDSPLTRLKQLWWRLDEAARNYWREQLESRRTLDSVLEEMNTKLGLQLKRNNQLSRFRKWLADQDKRDAERDRMLEDERRLRQELGKASRDKLRTEVLRRSYARTIAEGDFKLGLSTVSLDLKERTVQLNYEKFFFDAANACRKKLPQLKVISKNPKLSDTQKIDLIRLKLFGKIVPVQLPPAGGSDGKTTPGQEP
jgi:hypothetical protein